MNTCAISEIEMVETLNGRMVHMPLGLLGFETIKKYVLVGEPEDAPFLWLQVVNDPTLAFLVLSPFEVLPDYQMELTDEDTGFLGLDCPSDALVFCIVTLKPGGQATMNLRGPIVFNRSTLVGKQVVLANDSAHALHYPLPTLG